MKIPDLPLLKSPSENWENAMIEIMKNEYVAKKCNREIRLKEKTRYIHKFCPELEKEVGKILDLGPGPGEFLEVCRYYGNDIFGVDAKPGDCEMGEEYLKYSILMSERQNLPIIYCGFENLLKEKSKFRDKEFFFINSQGSIEQIFKKHLLGEPHKIHKTASKLTWNITDELKKDFNIFIKEVKRILTDDGFLLIYGNGATNTEEYEKILLNTVKEVKGFKILIKQDRRLHKFRRV